MRYSSFGPGKGRYAGERHDREMGIGKDGEGGGGGSRRESETRLPQVVVTLRAQALSWFGLFTFTARSRLDSAEGVYSLDLIRRPPTPQDSSGKGKLRSVSLRRL